MRAQNGKRILDDKTLELKLKAGFTLKEFCSYFEVAEDEFWPLLEKEFPRNYCRYIKKRIDSNERKASVKEATQKAKEEKKKIVVTPPMLVTSVSLNPEEEKLKDLEAKKKLLESDILKNEKSINQLTKDKKALKSELSVCKERFESLRKEFDKLSAHTDSIRNALNTTQDKIVSLETETQKNTLALKSLDDKIEQLKIVHIFFYEDGTIEAKDKKVHFSEEEISEKYLELISNKALENCTIKKIKQLASLIKFVSSLNGKGYDITFEEQEIEKIYNDFLA